MMSYNDKNTPNLFMLGHGAKFIWQNSPKYENLPIDRADKNKHFSSFGRGQRLNYFFFLFSSFFWNFWQFSYISERYQGFYVWRRKVSSKGWVSRVRLSSGSCPGFARDGLRPWTPQIVSHCETDLSNCSCFADTVVATVKTAKYFLRQLVTFYDRWRSWKPFFGSSGTY